VPAISTDLFKKNFTTTPESLNSAIRAFCRDINPKDDPVYVPAAPDAAAVRSECFNNVAAKVAIEGGTLVYGWLIWVWPRVFVEAEHHAIWEKDGTLVDITPPINGEQRILFLPDPTQTYDFASQKRRINIKRNSGVFSSVDGWIAAADRLQQAIEDNSTGNQVTLERSYLSALGRDIQNSLAAVFVDLARATRPNDPCFCTSGKKFKKCCGPLVQLYP
jgi:Uncharacterized protein conserved in bacteria